MLERWGTPLAFALALVPGALAWWRGRKRIADAAGDRDALAAGLVADARRGGYWIGASAALVWLTPYPVPALLLCWLGALLGQLPARRALTGERLGSLASLGWALRTWLGLRGVALITIVGALVAVQLGVAGAWVGAGLALIVAAMLRDPPAATRRLLAGEPVEDPDLLRRFEELRARARTELPVTALVVGHPEQYLPGAWATASVRRGAVAYGRTLIDALELDEIGAIHAHELAHIERWDPRKLGRDRAIAMSAIAALLVALPWLVGTVEVPLPVVLLALLITPLLVRQAAAAASRKRETECDRRAVELLDGDAEPLVRALEKLTRLHFTPARLAPAVEQALTHPSLAHRVLALRRAAREAAGREAADAVEVELAREGDRLRVDGEGVSWNEGQTEHRVDARDLRLVAVQLAPDGDFLVLRSRPGGLRRAGHWRLPIHAADAERLDDAVTRFRAAGHDAPGVAPIVAGPPWVARTLARVAAGALAVMAVLPAIPTVLLVPAVALLVRPTRRWMDVAALACAVALALTYLWPSPMWTDSTRGADSAHILLALVTAICVLLRLLLEDERTPRLDVALAATLAVAGVAAWSGALLDLGDHLDLLGAHLVARARPAGAIAPLALAGLLLRGPRAGQRWFGAGAALGGTAWALLGSVVVLTFGLDDPLACGTRPHLVTEREPVRVEVLDLEGWDGGLRLSPGGSVTARAHDHTWDPLLFSVEGAATGAVVLPARDLRFVDETHVVVLREQLDGAGFAVELLEIANGLALPRGRRALPVEITERMEDPVLGESVGTGGSVRVSGYDGARLGILEIELPAGALVDETVALVTRSWILPVDIELDEGWWVLGGGAPPLVVGDPGDDALAARPLLALLEPGDGTGHRLDTRFVPWTFGAAAEGAPQVVVGSDGARSHLWSVDAVSRRFTEGCAVEGAPAAAASDAPDTLALYTTRGELLRLTLDPAGCAVERIALPGSYSIYELAYTSDTVVALAALDGAPVLLRLEL